MAASFHQPDQRSMHFRSVTPKGSDMTVELASGVFIGGTILALISMVWGTSKWPPDGRSPSKTAILLIAFGFILEASTILFTLLGTSKLVKDNGSLLLSVQDGQPVAGTKSYNLIGEPHRISIVDASGLIHPWNNLVEENLRASHFSHLELVVILRTEESRVQVDQTTLGDPMLNSPWENINISGRIQHGYRYDTWCHVFEAASGKPLGQQIFEGTAPTFRRDRMVVKHTEPAPPGFPTKEIETWAISVQNGLPPTFEQVSPLLESFIHGGK